MLKGLNGMGLKALGLLSGLAVLAAPSVASAHAYVTDPPARDADNPDEDARAHKSGPCGGIARKGMPKQYTPGQDVIVRWKETIPHQGCFQIGFSAANDTGFTLLQLTAGGVAQINDPAGGANMTYQASVKLPTTPCPACTLVVRQLMQGQPCPANADPAMSLQGTYYSCADICIGSTCTPAGGTDAGTDGGSSGSSGTSGTSGTSGSSGTSGTSGVSTTPTDGGGKTVGDDGTTSGGPRSLRSGEGDDGCNVGAGGASSTAFAVLAGFFALSFVRRRRAR